MSDPTRHFNEIDEYIDRFTEDEQEQYRAAEVALDLACILYQVRQERGLTQTEAAQRAGLHQQAISRLEKNIANVQINTLQRYLRALGYTLDLVIKDAQTGSVVGQTSLSAS